MSALLEGRRIAILATDGVEGIELTEPRRALEEVGATVELLAPQAGSIQSMDHQEKRESLPVDRRVSEADPGDYDGLVLPGGVANPDALRLDYAAVEFIKEWVAARKPIAAICHASWSLIEANVVRGKTMTSWPSLATDLTNAGAEWVDKEVQVCPANGWVLVSSRKPDDLPAFNRELVTAFELGS